MRMMPCAHAQSYRALLWAGFGLAALVMLAMLPGSWDTAYGQTAPPPTPTPVPIPPEGGTATLITPSGQTAIVSVSALVVNTVPAGTRLEVVLDPQPPAVDEVQSGQSLGGGNSERVDRPVDIKVQLIAADTGQASVLPPNVSQQTVQIALPVIAQPTAPNQEFDWLVEVCEDGQFLGYMRVPSRFDPATGRKIYDLPIADLQCTLFLPVIIRESWVANFDPNVRIFSSPFRNAADFGVAAPQFTFMKVVAPQVGRRLFVYNLYTRNYGWIDVAGVGPVGPPGSP